MQLYYANIVNYIPNLNLFSHFCREVSNPALQANIWSLKLDYAVIKASLCVRYN